MTERRKRRAFLDDHSTSTGTKRVQHELFPQTDEDLVERERQEVFEKRAFNLLNFSSFRQFVVNFF